MFLFLLFLHFHSCSSFFPVPLFHLFCYLFCRFFSLSLGDDTKWPTRVDVSLNPNTINQSNFQPLKLLDPHCCYKFIYFNGKQCRSRSVGLIWIYTVCKGRVYLGSAGQGLTLSSLSFRRCHFQLWIWPCLLLQMWVPVRYQKQNEKQCRSWWDCSLVPVEYQKQNGKQCRSWWDGL